MPSSQAPRNSQPGAQAQRAVQSVSAVIIAPALPFLAAMEEVVPPPGRTLLNGKQASGALSASAEHHTSVGSLSPSLAPRRGVERTKQERMC